jgi:outer membrane receptor for ferrienterochelin and colicins
MRYWVLIIFICTAMLCCVEASAQDAGNGRLICKVQDSNGPLPFATVFLPGLNKGAAADSLGIVTFNGLPAGKMAVEASFVGYFKSLKSVELKNGQTTELQFVLENLTMEEVVVSGTMREVLRTESPIPVERISSRRFQRNPGPTLMDVVGMISGVQPVVNCNVCNTGDIQINGIEGVYTQVLIDGMPVVSGLGTVYGLSGIPNGLIDRIEVVKGPAGALYGSEAMAGQINIITKDAIHAPAWSLDFFSTSWGELNLDAGTKVQVKEKLSGLFGVNGFLFDQPIDQNADGFTDLAQQKRFSLFNKWQLERKSGKPAMLAGRYVWEDRWGGQTDWTKADRGGDVRYGESIYTRRLELFGLYQLPTTLPIFVQGSFNVHDQDSYYGTTLYLAKQSIGFLQAYLEKDAGKHHLLAGSALRYTNYNDNTPATATNSITLLPGVFIQDEWSFSRKSVLLSGLRLDLHPEHGAIWSPRIALRQDLGDRQQLRFNVGSGFRVVNLFTEDHAALSGAREVVIAEALDPERSWSGSLNYRLKVPSERFFLNFDLSAFYSHFFNRILPDYDTDPRKIIYSNLDGHAVSRGVTLQMEYSDGLPLRLDAGITYMEVFQQNGAGGRVVQIRAPKWSGTFSANYTHPGSRIALDLTGNWFGPQRLPVVPNDFRPEFSPWYALINMQLSRTFKGGLEVYGGVKNLLNFIPQHPILRPFDPFDRQVEDTEQNPFGYFFDPSYNFAPLQGIRGYAGFRVRL